MTVGAPVHKKLLQHDQYKSIRDNYKFMYYKHMIFIDKIKHPYFLTVLYKEWNQKFPGWPQTYFYLMEYYYLVHRVLSEKYGESHVRTIDSNDSVFEVCSGKCSDGCEGIAVLENDRDTFFSCTCL